MITSWRARLAGIMGAVLMTAGLLTATATPASAAVMKCLPQPGVDNACLTIEYAGDGRWDVSIGFDRYLPKAYADEILACQGGGVFFAVLWGDDGGHPEDDQLNSVPLSAGFPNTGTNPEGVFAEFRGFGAILDEDNGTDEVYAEVTYYDCHVDAWFTYRTGTHVGKF